MSRTTGPMPRRDTATSLEHPDPLEHGDPLEPRDRLERLDPLDRLGALATAALAARADRRSVVSGVAAAAAGAIVPTRTKPKPGPVAGTTGELRGAATVTSPFAPGLALDADPAWHLARRTSLNATAEVAAEIRRAGAAAWIDQQLAPSTIPDTVCDGHLATSFSRLTLSISGARAAWGGDAWKGAPYVQRATAVRQVYSRRRLLESMVELFGDLLYVPFASDKSSSWVAHWDTNVIRPHALGKYRLMLRAGLRHPALLTFIDNDKNSADSINENLGRELLELHTVGTGAYTEADVKNSSRILTGHGFVWPTLEYTYRPAWHYVGPVKVMGFSHANSTADGGPAVLDAYADYLARHPATATRIARRLAVRFVSDTPSASLVNELARLYLANDTDIRPALRHLLLSAEFRGSVGQKLRRPVEVHTSAIATGRPALAFRTAPDTDPWASLWSILHFPEAGGHGIRTWPAVNGFPDVATAWSSTSAALARFAGAHALAYTWDQDMVIPDWLRTLGITAGMDLRGVANDLVVRFTGFRPSAVIRDQIVMMLWDGGKTLPPAGTLTSADRLGWYGRQAVALVLCSPYMMIR